MGKNELDPKRPNPVWPVAPAEGGLAISQGLPGAGYGYGAPAASELNLAMLWRILFEWRWFILGAVAVGLVGAIIFTLLATPIYRSTAVIELNPPRVEIMETSKAGPMANQDAQFLATEYGLLRSRSLAERVVQDLNLASDETLVPASLDRASRERYLAAILSSGFEVQPLPASRLIRISYSSSNPGLAARVVNGFADSFINSGLERRYQASSYARDFLQRQISTTRRELENSERQLIAYAQRQRIINTGGQSADGEGAQRPAGDTNSLSGASLIALNTAFAEAQTRRIAAEQRYRESLGATTTAEMTERTALLRAQKAALDAEYQEKSAIFRPDYPEMVRLRARIDAIDASIRNESTTVRSSRSNTLRAEYQAALAEERSLGGEVRRLQGTVLDERGRSIQYNILQRDVDTNRALYDALLQRYKEIGVAAGIGASQASVVDRGEVPSGPYSPNMMLNLLIGLGLGFIVGVGGAVAAEFINDTIKSPDDVRSKLQLAFLGAIPKKETQSILDELQDTSSPLSEAYFSVGTSLQFSSDSGVPKTLLITSTRASEGKSTSSWAIAQSFARMGKSVLLVDADMRKPSFTTGLENTTGLSNLLTNNEPLAAHTLRTESENIWLLPSGPRPPNPAELLSSPRLAALFREASNRFDLVVVDGPPVLGLADAPLLGSVCHGTMLVVETGKTRTKAAVEALNRLRAAGAHLVGAVLTRYRHEAASGYGYYVYEPYRYGRGIKDRSREIRLVTHRAE